MKVLPALLAALFLVAAPESYAQTANQIYSEAQRAYLAGDLDTAKEKFRMVLAVDPKHQPSINYMRLIETSEAQEGGGKKAQKTLETVIVPEVAFRDASLGTALDFLAQEVAKESDGKVGVNFVRQLPPGYEEDTKITLKLRNTPLPTVLRYIGDLANVTFEIEKYAIVVRQKGGTAVPAATREQPSEAL